MNYLIYLVIYLITGLVLMFSLWILYLAGMHLKKIPFVGGRIGKIFIFIGGNIGSIINLCLNYFYLSIICLDFTHWKTCSSRLEYYNTFEKGDSWLSNWRLTVCDWWEYFVNPYDPKGTHIGGEDKTGKL